MRLQDLLKYQDIVIQCHDNPDADALASGYALWWYFRKMGKDTRFIYRGRNRLNKSNLRIMIERLDIPVSYEPDFSEVPELLVTVDCQYGQKNVTRTEAETVAVIDHHQVTGTLPELSEVSELSEDSVLLSDFEEPLSSPQPPSDNAVPVSMTAANREANILFCNYNHRLFVKNYKRLYYNIKNPNIK